MSRIAVALQALHSLARTPSLLNHVIAGDMAETNSRTASALEPATTLLPLDDGLCAL